MGWLYLDTGAMYRAVGLAFLDAELPATDEAAAALLPHTTVDLAPVPDGLRVTLNGADVTGRIRTPEAGQAASRVAVLGPVRAKLVDAQRRIARREAEAGGGVVLEGRDIGTVVFPDADVKIFMQADLAALARADEAVLLETPARSVEEQVEARLDVIRRRGGAVPPENSTEPSDRNAA